ncbi:P-loop containing nucleoside triphosphate hydrolase protein [Coniochaeta sp. 2T2.1]|nr:P-loop containing nucleoside triphosphate hydrolase protein [Coniochaeta sp. 2T2.1]
MTVTTSPSDTTDTERGPNKDAPVVDVEKGAVIDDHLRNTTVQSLSWSNVTVTVKDRETKFPKAIVEDVQGIVHAGEICALMGPSGSGKTTLLNVLASRPTHAQSATATVLVNGVTPSTASFRSLSCFVEQEDALIGALTVQETLTFASRLSTSLPAAERKARIDSLLSSFGLVDQADTLVGTPLRKGISGGQKRRLGVASQLITCPKILFLDEPTSGLDSAASWEVVNYLRSVAQRHNLIVVASIHQPSTSTFNLFDKLLLLSAGRTHYFGPVAGVAGHYERELGMEVPLHVNPAEFLLEVTNIDFARHRDEGAEARLEEMRRGWEGSERARELAGAVAEVERRRGGGVVELDAAERKPGLLGLVVTLLHRSFIKSYRDVVVYGIRFAMYFGLAVMMGTVWLRLSTDQSSIIPLTNAIFYGSAFMSFMAVAYVPAFLEDLATYTKESLNGLYTPTHLIVSNFLIGIPPLFLISLFFSLISYWLSNFRPEASAFFVWVLWLFLDLLAAESLVVLVSSIFPSFVISLALVAFANGLWMSVDGFMVQPGVLNVFYRYVFHYWDYQKYVFENMMVNEFAYRTYECAKRAGEEGGCFCMFPSVLEQECKIAGQGVLDQYGYKTGRMGRDIGIMMAIIVGYRLAAWGVLMLKRK